MTIRDLSVRFIPHGEQRYDTVGDYFDSVGVREVRISKMPDARYEQLVLIHELVELFLCDLRGIAIKEIDAFDMAHLDSDEPGALPDAPYHREHMFATKIERMVADEMGVDWDAYEKAVQACGAEGEPGEGET